ERTGSTRSIKASVVSGGRLSRSAVMTSSGLAPSRRPIAYSCSRRLVRANSCSSFERFLISASRAASNRSPCAVTRSSSRRLGLSEARLHSLGARAASYVDPPFKQVRRSGGLLHPSWQFLPIARLDQDLSCRAAFGNLSSQECWLAATRIR